MAKTTQKDVPLEAQTLRAAPEAPGAELRLYANFANHYVHVAKHGVTLDDVMRPGFWRNHWRLLPKWTEITVVAADNTWEARLRVISNGEAFANCRMLSHWTADPVDKAQMPADWKIEYVDSGWRIRNASGAIVTHSHATEALAVDAGTGFINKLIR